MPKYDERFDAYIGKAADYAKPILTHIRKLVHEADPDIEETIKWGHLFFVRAKPVCFMAAFKKHCNFGFWSANQLPDPEKILKNEGQQSLLNQIYTINDLPADEILNWYIKNAVTHSVSAAKIKGPAKPKAKASDMEIPEDFQEAIDANHEATAAFKQFSASKRNEYIEWITEAKTEATRTKRLATAIEWIAEGKSRNWKYQK
ncbi:YdeI/OmpD-associated family protein [Mucilaginibacter ginkgonis]|uniref:YdeI/OmpD-associated family protein n=1 Tax=Mucilaginibacter ginkgonis TaxID=2682091 RepID=A0A6I4HWY9_9SPHI|nr:YdeI/OmpD-associated family protein [Mucilaginibacter ginkgonis]QQL49865.1 YdeI/OmpD-associated family protein [Mucilaginibacter ginkgonis]